MGKRQDRSVGRIQWSSFWSTKTRTSWRTSVSWCSHRIVRVLWIWIALPSRLHQQDLNTLRIRAVLSLLLLFTLCTLTRVAPEFSYFSGSKRSSPWENSHEATIRIICRAKLRMVMIGRIITMMSALKWAVHVEFSLNFLLTWRQWRSCTELGTLASCSTCMLPPWHLQQQHQPCGVVPSSVLVRKLVEHDEVPSVLAHDGDGTHNIVVSEDSIWSPVLFS